MKNYIKNIFSLLVCLTFFVMMPMHINATHIVGGDISYKCLGNDNYEVTLKVRRDCVNGDEDAQFDDPASIGIYDSFGNLQVFLGSGGQIILPFMASDTIVDDLESGGCGFVGSGVCVHETTYRSIVNFPNNGFDYVLSYQRCCRNATLANVFDPLNSGTTYTITLSTLAMETCNSSPVFDAWADIYICANEPLSFNHTATDADGDVLVYKLCAPLDGASFDDPIPQPPNAPPYNDVTWNAGFSAANMLGGTTPLTIDSSTGTLTGLPTAVGQYLIGVCVEEYRNGELLSVTRRDFEYNVVICLPGFNSLFTYGQDDCTIPTVSFTGLSQEADQFTWFFDYPNTDPNFMSTDQNPVFDYGETGTYIVRMEGVRTADGCKSSFMDTITVIDQAIQSQIDLDIIECLDDQINLQFTDLSDSLNAIAIDRRLWILEYGNVTETSAEQMFTMQIPYDEDVTVTLSVTAENGCNTFTSLSFNSSELLPKADFDISLIGCDDEDSYNIALNDRTDHGGFNVSSWDWIINDNGNISNVSGPTVMINVSGQNLIVELAVTYDNGCPVLLEKDFGNSLSNPILDIRLEKLGCFYFPSGPNATGISADRFNVISIIDSTLLDVSQLDYQWIVNDTLGSTEDFTSINRPDEDSDSIKVQLIVSYNACQWSIEETYVRDDFGYPEYDLEVLSCDGDSVEVLIYHTGPDYPMPFNYEKSIEISGDISIEVEDSLRVNLHIGGEYLINANYIFSEDNGNRSCHESFGDFEFINFEDYLPQVILDYEKNFCDADGITYQISADFGSNVAPQTIQWNYSIDGVNFTSADNPFEILAEDGQEIIVSLDATFSQGCVADVDALIFNASGANLSLVANTFVPCQGDTVALFNNYNSNWDYSFDPVDGIVELGGEPHVLTNIDQTFGVTVTDGFCTDEGTFSVSMDDDLNIDVILEKTDCNDQGVITYNVSSTAGNMNIMATGFQWSYTIDGVPGSESNSSFELVLNEGEELILDLVVDFENGCIGNADQVSHIARLPEISFTAEVLNICENDSIALLSNPNPDFNYNWSPTTGLFFPNGDTSNPQVIGTQNISYAVTVSDGACMVSSSVDVNVVNEDLEIEISGETVVCDGQISLAVANAISGVDYEWSETSDFIDLIQDANLNIDFTANNPFDTLFLYVRPSSESLACLADVFEEVMIVNGNKEIDFTHDLDDCESYTICFEAINLTGESNWDFGDVGNPMNQISNNPTPCHTYPAAGEYTVSLSESNAICNADDVQMIINVPEILSISSAIDTLYFTGDTSVVLNVNTTALADSVAWCSDGVFIGTGNPFEWDIVGPQVLTAKVSNEYGCTDSVDIQVQMFNGFNEFEIVAESDTVCSEDIFNLEVFTNMSMSELSFEWMPSECILADGNTARPTVSTETDKNFSVRIIDFVTGFDTTLSILITVSNPEVNINSINGDELFLGQSTDLIVTNVDDNSSYEWSTGESGTSITVNPELETTYTVTVTDEFGCTATAEYTLSVLNPTCTEEDVFLPTGFSPNGDSANDVFIVRSNFIKTMELTVYNRWGEQLFVSTDQSVGWDGTYKGEPLPPDAFAFCLKVVCVDDQEYVKTGNVNLVR